MILSHVLAALNLARASRCYPKLSKSRRARLSLCSGAKKSTLPVAFKDFILDRKAMLCCSQMNDFYRWTIKLFLAQANEDTSLSWNRCNPCLL